MGKLIVEDFFDDVELDNIQAEEANISSNMFLQFTFEMQLNSFSTKIENLNRTIRCINRFNTIISNLLFADNAELVLFYNISRRGNGDWKDYKHCTPAEMIQMLPEIVSNKEYIDVENGTFSNLIIIFEFHFVPNKVSFTQFSNDMFKLETYALYGNGFSNMIRLYEDGKCKHKTYKDGLFSDLNQQYISQLYNAIYDTHGNNFSEKYKRHINPLYKVNDKVVKRLIGLSNYQRYDNYEIKLRGYNFSLESFTANCTYIIVLDIKALDEEHKKLSNILELLKKMINYVDEGAYSSYNAKYFIYLYVYDESDIIMDCSNQSLILFNVDNEKIIESSLTLVDRDGNRLRMGRIRTIKTTKEYLKAISSFSKYQQYIK